MFGHIPRRIVQSALVPFVAGFVAFVGDPIDATQGRSEPEVDVVPTRK